MTTTDPDIRRRLEAIRPRLAKRYRVSRIALFGSAATGKLKPGSDVDLLIEFDEAPGFEYAEMIEELEAALGRPVDVLTPDGLGSVRVPSIADSIRGGLVYV